MSNSFRIFFYTLFLTFLSTLHLKAEDALPTAGTSNLDVTSWVPQIFLRMFSSGFVVGTVLFILISFSVVTWAIIFVKWRFLKKVKIQAEAFQRSFWESRSLNDLNGRLEEFPYSPHKEIFRSGYGELLRVSNLKQQTSSPDLALTVSVDNLQRSLLKAKRTERKTLETYLSILAITASVCPFIGLFGTVWGIMNAFEGIARSGSASLAAVAPGISEALIATAFGLAAAIPAVIGYNFASHSIRNLVMSIDSFSADFMNIVERYLVVEKQPPTQAARSGTGGPTQGFPPTDPQNGVINPSSGGNQVPRI